MPRYRYKAKTIEGKAVRGTKEAAEPRYLLACLKEKGLYCYEYHIENMEQSFRPPVLRRKALPPFCKQLSAMLGALEPMNPYERRIIHSALQSDPYVTTHSEGEEPYRKVVVTLKK